MWYTYIGARRCFDIFCTNQCCIVPCICFWNWFFIFRLEKKRNTNMKNTTNEMEFVIWTLLRACCIESIILILSCLSPQSRIGLEFMEWQNLNSWFDTDFSSFDFYFCLTSNWEITAESLRKSDWVPISTIGLSVFRKIGAHFSRTATKVSGLMTEKHSKNTSLSG